MAAGATRRAAVQRLAGWAAAGVAPWAAGGAWAARPGDAAVPDAREAARSAHFPFGPVVPPRPLEAWSVTTHAGQAQPLPALLQGRISALQLMFTGCSSSCPIQGALFAQAQRLATQQGLAAQFVSLSIDALGDTPQALAAWLQRLQAAPGWLAALPRVADVEAIVQRIGSGGERRPAGPDPHVQQVFVFDRRAQLVLRTPAMPEPARIVEALQAVQRRG